MKKILIGTVIGVVVSIFLFAWGWNGMEKTYLIPKNIAIQKSCNQLQVCQKCDRNYECIKNECENNSTIKNSCQSIEENWKNFPIEFTPDNFISSLCGENNDFYIRNCLVREKDNFELEVRFALAQISYNAGISDLLFLGIELSSLGIIILFIPILIGFLSGLVIYSREKVSKLT